MTKITKKFILKDERGNIILRKEVGSFDGTPTSARKIEYQYNEKNLLIKRVSTSSNTDRKHITDYIYDNTDRLIKKIRTILPKDTIISIVYEYLENGDVLRRINNMKGHTRTIRYVYDDNHKCTKIITDSETIEFIDGDDNTVKMLNNGKVLNIFTYDEKGNIIKRIVGKSEVNIEYNDDNRISKITGENTNIEYTYLPGMIIIRDIKNDSIEYNISLNKYPGLDI